MFLIVKIERFDVVRNFDEIFRVVDGVMVVRGDFGVEMFIEKFLIF